MQRKDVFSELASRLCDLRLPGSIRSIQLFRERLLEKSVKVHVIIRKGIVGSFEFVSISEKSGKMAQDAMDLCLCVLKESNKSRLNTNSVRTVPCF